MKKSEAQKRAKITALRRAKRFATQMPELEKSRNYNIVVAHENGATMREIALHLKMSAGRIHQIIKESR